MQDCVTSVPMEYKSSENKVRKLQPTYDNTKTAGTFSAEEKRRGRKKSSSAMLYTGASIYTFFPPPYAGLNCNEGWRVITLFNFI